MTSLTSLAIFLLSFCASVNSDKNSWWDNETSKSVECCECIPFYGCPNGTYIDRKIIQEVEPNRRSTDIVNRDVCPNIQEVCCLLNDHLPEQCRAFKPPHFNGVISDVRRECQCFHWQICPLDLIVTDNRGLTSNFLTKIGLQSHSKCSKPNQVCCGFDEEDKSFTGLQGRNGGSFPTSKPVLFNRAYGHDNSDTDNYDEPKFVLKSRSGETCECVPKNLCLEDGTVNTNGHGIFDPRVRGNQCDDPTYVCCLVLPEDPVRPINNAQRSGGSTHSGKGIFQLIILNFIASVIFSTTMVFKQ